jgi:ATP-binding cassette subfamily F protein 3
MEYFAQDEATRLDPTLTVHDTLQKGSPMHMVPMIRNILGGFLFEGDDVFKKAAVLSGGERTRLAVARMLLRPSNTLLMDEPTNHLDLDSKDVLLDALVDYGGTLIFVSHDRYFVERLATKIIEIGHGHAIVFPGTYTEFLWHKGHPGLPAAAPDGGSRRQKEAAPERRKAARGNGSAGGSAPARREGAAGLQPAAATAGRPSPNGEGAKPRSNESAPASGSDAHEARKRERAEEKRRQRELAARRARVSDLETRIADRERQIKELEGQMSAAGFYQDRATAQPTIDRHQALMWEVGELMHQWEALCEVIEQE